jgi:SAM-dependent methyltransferase
MRDDTSWADRQARQAAAFDAIGRRYDEAFPHKEGQLTAGAWLLAGLPAGARVLDVGCGTGLPTARQLVDGGMDLTGIDISPGMLELARENVPEARLERLDLLDLPGTGWPRFDAVVAFFALLMLPRPKVPHALGVLHEALRPDGLLVLSMVEADLTDVLLPFLGQDVLVSGYRRDDLRAVVKAAGFAIEHEDSRTYLPSSRDAYIEVQIFLHCRRTG